MAQFKESQAKRQRSPKRQWLSVEVFAFVLVCVSLVPGQGQTAVTQES